MEQPYLQIKGLSKRYSKKAPLALDDLTLSVPSGEVYGFLGANGAGKSTAIRLLLNFIQPSSGTARVMGKDIVKDSVAVKNHVGYLAGDVALWPKVTGRDLFAYLSQLQKKDTRSYLDQLIKRFKAEPDTPIADLSKGNRQKIGLIQALMHQPDVLILDEPTSGLDPLMQEEFYKCIAESKARGAAVFVSSHNLAETQRMCDRIGIIRRGKLVHEQVLSADSSLAAPVIRVVLANQADADKLKKSSHLKVLSGDGLTLVVQPATSIKSSLAELSRYAITSFSTEPMNLEDEFMEFYGDGA